MKERIHSATGRGHCHVIRRNPIREDDGPVDKTIHLITDLRIFPEQGKMPDNKMQSNIFLRCPQNARIFS